MRRIFRTLALAWLFAAFSSGALAQTFPSKPVRIIVPYAAGGTTDILARLLGQRLQEFWSQPVVVDNKPGAATNLGAEIAAKAAADGYTLLFGTNATFAVNPHLYDKLAFAPLKDFSYVAPIALTQTVLLVNPQVSAKTVQELVVLAKSAPAKLTYGSYGSGSLSHLAAAQFASMAGIDMTHVPYKGSAPAMTDLVGGHIHLMFDNIVTALPHARSGKVRAVAVTGAQRTAAAPELPTVAESGVPSYQIIGWFGIAVPTGTPVEIVRKLNADINRALQSPDIKEKIISAGADSMNMSSAEFAAFVNAEYQAFGRVVKASGARAD